MKWKTRRIASLLSGIGLLLGSSWAFSKRSRRNLGAEGRNPPAPALTEPELVYEMPPGPDYSEARRDAYFTVRMEAFWEGVDNELGIIRRRKVGNRNPGRD